ncbi:MAG: cupin domain-containing protein [Sphingomonas sp.]|uniref:1,2-dihydroxy-3-keto-5-methylthiopentene dioxygenase n=1 Tax=Sphingomonas sp. TaxID=28214 RepID=UPI0025D026F6|nr:cupin domain-containing protein [Sphingomonas sp.]MBY0283367.1 cupin domain-containing protein [Sphingomonas sp.]
MSHLQIFGDSDANALLMETGDPERIALELAGIGVRFERWPTRPVASADEVLTAYAAEIEKLVAADGYQSIDVMGVTPDHPERATIRTKFLSEHTHAEDEIRFFVDGEGLFTLHEGGRVFNMLCTKGDLISVPAGMRHWFDMGAAPKFTVIRLFLNPDGWIAQFTGDDIATRFPRLERADA